MPIYEYECRHCGKVAEQVVLNPRTEVIPVCIHYTVGTDGETHYPMRRRFSASAIHFKGSGFYATDYKDKK